MASEASEREHQPVLLEEAIMALNIKADGIYIDGTFGRGGHSAAILSQLNEQGRLIAFDKDPQAIKSASRFANDPRFSIEHASFTEMYQVAKAKDLLGKVDGILLDLGVSSPQLDDPQRGFSFSHDGPLDMRMNTQKGESAAEWLMHVSEKDLAQVLKEYGEERFAKRIARAIVSEREKAPITTTRQLSSIVAAANPAWEKHKDPATRSFQAIRIFINRELDDLVDTLEQVVPMLGKGGRLAVISFHSLEDRIVKQFIRRQVKGDELPHDLPVMHESLNTTMISIGKAIKAGEKEIKSNPRARSAVLRIAERK